MQPRLPQRRLPRRAAAGHPVRREPRHAAERRGPRARRLRRADPGRLLRRLDQAQADRRHRHEQEGRHRDRPAAARGRPRGSRAASASADAIVELLWSVARTLCSTPAGRRSTRSSVPAARSSAARGSSSAPGTRCSPRRAKPRGPKPRCIACRYTQHGCRLPPLRLHAQPSARLVAVPAGERVPALRLRRLDAQAHLERQPRDRPRHPLPPPADRSPPAPARASVWRRCFSRLPHVAIEHQRRRPDGSRNSQPQRRPGQARIDERRSESRNSAAAARWPAPGDRGARGGTHPLRCEPRRRGCPLRFERHHVPAVAAERGRVDAPAQFERPGQHGPRRPGSWPPRRGATRPLCARRAPIRAPRGRAPRSPAGTPSDRARPSPRRCCRARVSPRRSRELGARRRRPRTPTNATLTTSR